MSYRLALGILNLLSDAWQVAARNIKFKDFWFIPDSVRNPDLKVT